MKTVLFVCVGNSARSQMAEGFFNINAPAGWSAKSAGTAPSRLVSQTAIGVMRERGIDISKNHPKPLTKKMLEEADIIISMGCEVDLCPFDQVDGALDWGLEDPIGSPIKIVRQIRDEIEKKVGELIKEIKAIEE